MVQAEEMGGEEAGERMLGSRRADGMQGIMFSTSLYYP